MRSLGIHLRTLSLDVKIPINKTIFKIAVLKWHLGLPGASELMPWLCGLPSHQNPMVLITSEGRSLTFKRKDFSCLGHHLSVNSLAPGKFAWNFRQVIFKQISVIDSWDISCEIALIWISVDFTDYRATLIQVMASGRQATSHYLSQCWPRYLSPYGVTRP